MTQINSSNQASIKGKIELLNVAPAVIIGGTALACAGLPWKGGFEEFWLQKDMLNHFKEKQLLSKDKYEHVSKSLGDKTVKFLKENKKYKMLPIIKGFGKTLGTIIGLYALTGLLISFFKKKYDIKN